MPALKRNQNYYNCFDPFLLLPHSGMFIDQEAWYYLPSTELSRIFLLGIINKIVNKSAADRRWALSTRRLFDIWNL